MVSAISEKSHMGFYLIQKVSRMICYTELRLKHFLSRADQVRFWGTKNTEFEICDKPHSVTTVILV
jgi:hypothetical protein